MRFSTVILSGALAAAASAQTTVGETPAQASATACLNACGPSDVKCQAHCIVVPSPNESQAETTNNCVAACSQGNGSPADTQRYSDCTQKCIGDYFFHPAQGTPNDKSAGNGAGTNAGNGAGTNAGTTAGANAGTNAGTNAGANGSGSTATLSGSATATSTHTASAVSSGLAPIATAAPAAILGLVAAVLAL
ncbi:hypothetical protein DCS_04725 [Drechmeria coniospora]|uniref:Uncharacterized protein n=1 Tax=Drechmeria coniospora TaxID=98403 RepID=A0A151GL27_DRECN|nr:hypothetical protein DCS_04725 [Drechmeria coniospora]KYK57712.1 hypothetical protein DCS_04725 [Drechmeria coniospora]